MAPVAESLELLPRERLPLNPKIENRAELDRALEELSYYDSKEATVNASLANRIDVLRKESQNGLRVLIGGKTLTFEERRAQLRAAIKEGATEHREELFVDGVKTLELTFGKIAWREQPEAIVFLDDKKPADVLKRIDQVVARENDGIGLIERLAAFVRKIKLFEVPVDTFVRIKRELDLKAIKKARDERQVSDSDLKRLGLSIEREPEELKIEVADYAVRAENRGKGPDR